MRGMRAIGLREFGGPDVLEELDLSIEPMEPACVRLSVRAAVVNPTDLNLRAGRRSSSPRPLGITVPGMEVSGVITEVHPACSSGLHVGDRAVATVLPDGEHGGYRQDLVLPEASVARAPSSTTFAEAATLPMNGLTARLALDVLQLDRGGVVAVTGAAGAVGGYAVQLAKAEGLFVVADADPHDAPLVRSLGADHIVPRGSAMADHVRRLFPDGVDAVVDAAALNEAIFPAMRARGRVATLRHFAGNGGEAVEVIPISALTYLRDRVKLDRLRDQVEAGAISLRVARVVPASAAGESHRAFAAGGVRGRIVLDLAGAEA